MTSQRSPGHAELVLSLFPGVDLLGRGFEAEGFCVVRRLVAVSACSGAVTEMDAYCGTNREPTSLSKVLSSPIDSRALVPSRCDAFIVSNRRCDD